MQCLGCTEAMNFDSGASAIMVFMGERVSHPSDVDTDGAGRVGRVIADILLYAECDCEVKAPELSQVDPTRIWRKEK